MCFASEVAVAQRTAGGWDMVNDGSCTAYFGASSPSFTQLLNCVYLDSEVYCCSSYSLPWGVCEQLCGCLAGGQGQTTTAF